MHLVLFMCFVYLLNMILLHADSKDKKTLLLILVFSNDHILSQMTLALPLEW